jgi:hypothetical protein
LLAHIMAPGLPLSLFALTAPYFRDMGLRGLNGSVPKSRLKEAYMKAGCMICVVSTVLAVLAIASPSWSACCIESCPSVPWISCTASTSCTGGVCPGPIGSAVAADSTATCGEPGTQFANCPTTEAGQCGDGVNNDAWTGNTATDCQDPACATDPHCTPAPAMSKTVLMIVFALLCLSGVAILRRRRA